MDQKQPMPIGNKNDPMGDMRQRLNLTGQGLNQTGQRLNLTGQQLNQPNLTGQQLDLIGEELNSIGQELNRIGSELSVTQNLIQQEISLCRARILAMQVRNSPGEMICGIWAQEFQERLNYENPAISFIPRVVLIRQGKNLNAMAHGVCIKYGGEKIGKDSHIFTIVAGYVFDNVNTRGVAEASYFQLLEFYDRDNQKLSFDKDADNPDVFFECVCARDLNDGIPAAIRMAKAKAKKLSQVSTKPKLSAEERKAKLDKRFGKK